MKSGIATVIRRFPERWEHIRWLIERDADFASLCEEYSLAHESLQQWKALTTPAAQERITEYGMIITELEQEIDHILQLASPVALRL